MDPRIVSAPDLDRFFGMKVNAWPPLPEASLPPPEHVSSVTPKVPAEPFKYHEGKVLDELRAYIAATYGQHYVGKNSIQANDLVLAGDRTEARGFWKWNAIKYLLRYGKKKGCNKQDLLKALHYAILLVYLDHEQDNGEGE